MGDLDDYSYHINMGCRTVDGLNNELFGTRFPDMTRAYDPLRVYSVIEEIAASHIPLKKRASYRGSDWTVRLL